MITYQPKVGEVSSAVHIHNYHVLPQVRLEESGKHSQFYRGATSALPLRSCLCDVFRQVHSIHGCPPYEVVLEAAVGWLCGHIAKADNYVHHVGRPNVGLRKSVLARGNIMDHMSVPHLLLGPLQPSLQMRHYYVEFHGVSQYDSS